MLFSVDIISRIYSDLPHQLQTFACQKLKSSLLSLNSLWIENYLLGIGFCEHNDAVLMGEMVSLQVRNRTSLVDSGEGKRSCSFFSMDYRL